MNFIFNNGTQLRTYDSKNKTKKCPDPLCGKIHKFDIFYCDCFGKNLMNTKNNEDLILSGFLPHLPYSWIRSVTNVETFLEILQNISISKSLYPTNIKEVHKHLFQTLVKNGRISIDESKKNDIIYIMGSPSRRVHEYINTFKILKLIDKDYTLTSLGSYLLKTKNTLVLFLSFYSLNIKNTYLSGAVYQNFDVYHFKNIFELLQTNKSFTIEDLMFLLTPHNEKDYPIVHEKLFKTCQNKNLRKNLLESYFFGKKNKEMQRQKAAIFNLLTSSNILEYRKNENDYILSVNAIECMNTLQSNYQEINSILLELRKKENNIIEFHENLDKLLNIFKNTLNKNTSHNLLIYKSGGMHENSMIKDFKNKGVNFRKYDKSYSNIILPADVISSLSGGTIHNPDQLCTIKGQNVLVDSKSSNSIHNEIHKVIAYNVYAEKIDSKTFIFLDNQLPSSTLEKIKLLLTENPEKINRIAIFTKNALTNLAANSNAKIYFENIFKRNDFTLVCTHNDKDFKKFEKDIPPNIYLITVN